MTIYTAVINQRAVAAEADMFKIKAPITDTGNTTIGGVLTTFPDSATDIRIREIRLGQLTEFADAAAELLSVQIIKYGGDTGSCDTGNGTTGTNLRVVPSGIDGHTPADTGGEVVRVVVTSDLLETDTGFADSSDFTQTIYSDTVNVAAGWWWYPPEEEMIILRSGETLVVRVSVPADSITWNGTLVFEKIGKASP